MKYNGKHAQEEIYWNMMDDDGNICWESDG
jgi:hypothetical protein